MESANACLNTHSSAVNDSTSADLLLHSYDVMDKPRLLATQKTADRYRSGDVLVLASPCTVLPYFVPPGCCKLLRLLTLLKTPLRACVRGAHLAVVLATAAAQLHLACRLPHQRMPD